MWLSPDEVGKRPDREGRWEQQDSSLPSQVPLFLRPQFPHLFAGVVTGPASGGGRRSSWKALAAVPNSNSYFYSGLSEVLKVGRREPRKLFFGTDGENAAEGNLVGAEKEIDRHERRWK